MENLEQADHEAKRIEILNSFSIMDTPPEISFDQLAHLASSVCMTPIALISFIDSERQWFKSNVGITLKELPRRLSACNITIDQYDIVELKNIPAEKSSECIDFLKAQGFGFYAGVPITTKSGFNVGTVCVIDRVPRALNKDQIKNMKIIANQIVDLLELRKLYAENLQKLRELSKLTYDNDRKIEDIAHKSSMRAMAELSAGLSYRIRMQMIIIENVRRRLLVLFSDQIADGGIQLNLLKESIENIFSIIGSLERYFIAEQEKWMKPLDLSSVIQSVLDHLDYKFKKHQIQMHVHMEKDIICVGNLSQITEVVFAVINNAIEAVEGMPDRKIIITLKKVGHYGVIQCKDTGHGVSPKIKPFIFQPFFTTKGPSGLGTGLSLAEAIVHKHSGDIALVHDSNPTVFKIVLPVP